MAQKYCFSEMAINMETTTSAKASEEWRVRYMISTWKLGTKFVLMH